MCGRDNLLGRGASFYKIQSLVSFSSSHLNKFKFKLTIQGNGLKSNEVKSTQKEDFVRRDNLLGRGIAVTAVINLPASGGRKEFVYDPPSTHI